MALVHCFAGEGARYIAAPAFLLSLAVLFSEFAKLGEGGSGLAGVDGFGAEADAFFQVHRATGGDESGCGVEQDNVATGAGNAGEDVVKVGSVDLHVSADELV